jgi:hypothetical protein
MQMRKYEKFASSQYSIVRILCYEYFLVLIVKFANVKILNAVPTFAHLQICIFAYYLPTTTFANRINLSFI